MLADKQIAVDTHTHTILSGHAFSTITENAQAAADLGMYGLCLCEHGPRLENGAPYFIPHSQRMVPDFVKGIRVFKGIEANLVDFEGSLDVPPDMLKLCEFVVASCHDFSVTDFQPGTKEQHTQMYLKVLENPYVDILGHPDNPKVPFDYDVVIEKAKAEGKLMELNNNRIASGLYGSGMKEYALLLKKHNQRACISTDAHFWTMVGNVSPMLKLLDSIDFPEDLIVNLTKERFLGYLDERKERIANYKN